jgi:hypothetical protein
MTDAGRQGEARGSAKAGVTAGRFAGLDYPARAAYLLTMNDALSPMVSPKRSDDVSSELTPSGTPPHVAVAPGVLDQNHVVIHADDDTDEDYEARSRVFAAALKFARDG